MRFLTIDESSQWLGDVQKLGDDSRLTLGFMPAQAFVDYAKRKQILALIIDDELAAYTMFRYKKTSLIIVHLCVSAKHRGHGYAKELMNVLYQQEKDYVSQFKLSCRRDYSLDNFWYSLGFAPMAEKPGRASKTNSILTTWIRPNPECKNLFTVDIDSDAEKIRVVLDSNIVIALYSENEVEVNALTQDFLSDYVEYYISTEVFNEINKQSDSEVRNNSRDFIKSWFSIIPSYDEQLYVEVRKHLLSLKNAKEYSNTWYDISHISYAIAFGAGAFVTRDTAWLNTAISDAIFEKYGLRILSPAELIRYIDEIDSPSSYSPQKLVGLNLEYSEMKPEDLSVVSDVFYRQYLSGKKSVFTAALKKWMAIPEAYHIFEVKSNERPVCLAVCRTLNNAVLIEPLLIDTNRIKPSLHSTFTKRIAFKLLENAQKAGATSISISMQGLSPGMITAVKECGYFENGHKLQRIIEAKIALPSTVTFDPSLDHDHPVRIAVNKYIQSAAEGVVLTQATIELEKMFWPLKILVPCVPCYIVPIQTEYAKKLFDENLSLFPNENMESALSVENIYYKSKYQSISCFPARILWYVSRSTNIGSSSIRACSYLDSVEIADKSILYKKYRRLGVFDWDDLCRIQGNKNCIAAYKFSYTELLPNPVGLDDVRMIIERPCATFQSFRKISWETFFKLYELGLYGRKND